MGSGKTRGTLWRPFRRRRGGLPDALRVRLACCPSLKAWDAGIQIADFLKDGNEPDRKAAAKFFHAVALRWMAEGDKYAAGEAIKAAAKAWPDHRLTMLNDPSFRDAGIF